MSRIGIPISNERDCNVLHRRNQLSAISNYLYAFYSLTPGCDFAENIANAGETNMKIKSFSQCMKLNFFCEAFLQQIMKHEDMTSILGQNNGMQRG